MLKNYLIRPNDPEVEELSEAGVDVDDFDFIIVIPCEQEDEDIVVNDLFDHDEAGIYCVDDAICAMLMSPLEEPRWSSVDFRGERCFIGGRYHG